MLQIYPDTELLDRLDAWRAKQRPILSRAAAARKLILLALDEEERDSPH
jgi:hypothetical protein